MATPSPCVALVQRSPSGKHANAYGCIYIYRPAGGYFKDLLFTHRNTPSAAVVQNQVGPEQTCSQCAWLHSVSQGQLKATRSIDFAAFGI
eukprot:1153806-Pelagomonas_calceolata.AAC.8